MAKSWRMRTVAAVAALVVVCGAAIAVELQSGDEVVVSGQHDQLVLAAGGEVKLALTATDDVVASGGDLIVDGSVLDHLFISGGELSVSNSTIRDLFAAGGEIDVITGEVSDDLIAAGGRITLGPEARIGGDVVIAGGNLRVESPIGGGLRAAGGTISLYGAINGDVYLDGGSIEIGPDTHILGTLTHRGRSVDIAPEAQVDGQITALRPRAEPDLRPLKMLAGWAAMTILFGMFLMGIVIAFALPRLMNGAAALQRRRPLSMFGLGIAIAVLTPIIAIFLMVTVFGLPLAFVLFAALVLLWPLSIVAAAYGIGMLIRGRTRMNAGAPTGGARVLWGGLGMILLLLLGLIPIAGFFIWLIAYFFGAGAVIAESWRALAKGVADAEPAPIA